MTLLRTIDIVMHGLGNVGRALLGLLGNPNRFERHGFKVRIVGAIDSRGGVWNPHGISPAELLAAKRDGGTVAALRQGEMRLTALDCQERSVAPLLLMECTLADGITGGPGFRAMEGFLENGADVITANKGPLVVGFPRLQELARAQGGSLKYTGTLGLPLLSICDHLRHVHIEQLVGVVNGTTNYILTEMSHGVAYQEALRRVQAAGVAEADPILDISGADAAHKLLILSHVLLRQPATLADVTIQGISDITHLDHEQAKRRGEVIKLLATADLASNGVYRLSVRPQAISKNHPLAGLSHTAVGIWLKTDINGEVMVSLTQLESTPTAAAMVHDLIFVMAAKSRACIL